MLILFTLTFFPILPDIAEAERGILDIAGDGVRVFVGAVGIGVGVGEIAVGTASAFTIVGIPITIPAWVKGSAMIGGGALLSGSAAKNLIGDVGNLLDGDDDEDTGPNDEEGGPNDEEGGPND